MSTFTVAGVSTQYGITKVRFANDLVSRFKLLSKGGHSPLELMELPRGMTKSEACQYLLDTGGVYEQWSGLIIETMGKKQGTVASKPAKAPAKSAPAKAPAKPVPAKKAVPAKAPKAPKAIEDDLELEELKQLAELEDAPI
jgi:hypothetical protein